MTKTYSKQDDYTLKESENRVIETTYSYEYLLRYQGEIERAINDHTRRLTEINALIKEAEKLGIETPVKVVEAEEEEGKVMIFAPK